MDKITLPAPDSTANTVQCPSCKTALIWDSSSPYRPFCSERCKNKDFIAWANEEHILAGSPVYDDVLSDDLVVIE